MIRTIYALEVETTDAFDWRHGVGPSTSFVFPALPWRVFSKEKERPAPVQEALIKDGGWAPFVFN